MISINQNDKPILPAILIGAAFFAVNAHLSYVFYHVNSFKILIVLISVTILIIYQYISGQYNFDRNHIKHTVILLLPLLATFPGLIYYQWQYNYNFRFELVINIVLIVWALYIYQTFQSQKEISILVQIIGVTVVYVFIRGILERYGVDQSLTGKFNVAAIARSKSTFGNSNYFAGFLIILIPLFLLKSLPMKFERGSHTNQLKIKINKKNSDWQSIGFLVYAIWGLWLTQTRAAFGATIIGIIGICGIITYLIVSTRTKKILLISLFVITSLILAIIVFLLLFPEHYDFLLSIVSKNRFTAVLSGEAWLGRLLSWKIALNSILSSPVIGYGLGASYNLFFLFKDPTFSLFSSTHSINHVHSEILEYMQETGIIGFIILIIFWGYLLKCLYTIFVRSKNGEFIKLALGIAGGFTGYGIHSLFSVAPRMMVTRLPLFTIIGLTLLLFKLYLTENKETTFNTTHKATLKTRNITFGAIIIFLTLSYTIYIPWIKRQRDFRQYQESKPSLFTLETFEKKTENWSYPDIYGLHRLATDQLKFNQLNKLKKTLDKISNIIPHYQTTDSMMGYYYIKTGDNQNALQTLKTFQRRDLYSPKTISLISEIAIQNSEESLFFKQVKLISKHYLSTCGVYNYDELLNLTVTVQPIEQILSQKKSGKFSELVWDRTFLSQVLQIAKKAKTERTWTKEEQEQFLQVTLKKFMQLPYLQIRIKKAHSNQKRHINLLVKQYINLRNEVISNKQKLKLKHKQQLAHASPTETKYILNSLRKEHRKKVRPIIKRLNEIEEVLIETTHWKEYFTKFIFITKMLSWFNTCMVPTDINKGL